MSNQAFLAIKKFNFWDSQPQNLGLVRAKYLKRLEKSLDSNLIKVLTGQRRVGKSYNFRQFIHHLITVKNVPAQNILYINLDLNELIELKSSEQFHQIFEQYIEDIKPVFGKKIYLFIDEIQEIENWEKLLNSYLANHHLDLEIFITGSNSKLLSSELGTYLTGRYISWEVYPFDYQENLEFQQQQNSAQNFYNYLFRSHLPETYNLKDPELISSYLSDLKDSILLRDIVSRYEIRNSSLLERLFLFLVDNIGNPFSINSIVKKLKALGYSTSTNTIADYLNYFEESYLFYSIDRYDIKGKRILEGEKKYYLNDTGFRKHLFSNFDSAKGKFLENYVHNFLHSHGYRNYIGQAAEFEVDFIAEKQESKIYLQVTYSLFDETVRKRELRSLENIDDNWPKYLITMDQDSPSNFDGIKVLQAWKLTQEFTA